MPRIVTIILVVILLIVLLFLLRMCIEPEQPPAGAFDIPEPPSVMPPDPDVRRPAAVDPGKLPPGGRARFSAFEGDNFFVTFPVIQRDSLTTTEVANEAVAPVLEAMGFDKGLAALRHPPESGVPLARANFAGLIAPVLVEAEGNPKAQGPKTQDLLAVFAGEVPADDAINNALKMGEGMDFAQFVAGIERQEILFPFAQIHDDVPIEHTSITAARWEGQGITAVWGSLINTYTVENTVALSPSQIRKAGAPALTKIDGIRCLEGEMREALRERLLPRLREKVVGADQLQVFDYGEQTCGIIEAGPVLVLLPYGTDGSGATRLRYSYRMIIRIRYVTAGGGEIPAAFQVWHDAETAAVLKLISLTHNVSARGEIFYKDPEAGTRTRSFEVDPASGGSYTLQLTDMMDRIDYGDDGYNASDTSISDSTDGSSATFANFNQAPINDETQAICSSGTNRDYEQVNVFASVYDYTMQGRSLGVFMPFPRIGSFQIDVGTSFCNAFNAGDIMSFGYCQGYTEADCPDHTGPTRTEYSIYTAIDNTWVAHEHAHSLTPRFTNTRPDDWCGLPDCDVPTGWGTFHDLADFWADHFESTNCWSGWQSKNEGVVDGSLYCAVSDEGGFVPRAHELEVPFDSTNPLDHFPEHRDLATGGYANMQMPTAMLWDVRLGMRSKCRWSGTPQFAVRYARGLKRTGFFAAPPAGTDLGLYRYLHDLEEKLMYEWTTAGDPDGPPAFRHNGPHTTNKVMAGFARGGVFLIPYQCLDDDAASDDPTACPTGTNGGDAVVDIDDNDPADDYTINGVPHKEIDFLELGGAAPTFHVWTGPRYQFDAAGGRTYPNPSLCNAEFQVEASTDPGFAPADTVVSPWQAVDRDPSTPASTECYGTWTPTAAEWTTLQSGGAGSLLHYRARTRDSGGGNVRLSTDPGAGVWAGVPAPYAVITADGLSDY